MSTKYFDNASTTRVAKEVLDEYVKATEEFYNPSALTNASVKIKQNFFIIQSLLHIITPVNQTHITLLQQSIVHSQSCIDTM